MSRWSKSRRFTPNDKVPSAVVRAAYQNPAVRDLDLAAAFHIAQFIQVSVKIATLLHILIPQKAEQRRRVMKLQDWFNVQIQRCILRQKIVEKWLKPRAELLHRANGQDGRSARHAIEVFRAEHVETPAGETEILACGDLLNDVLRSSRLIETYILFVGKERCEGDEIVRRTASELADSIDVRQECAGDPGL